MIKKYVEQALKICLSMRENERVLIITDKETNELGQKFLQVAKGISPNIEHPYFIMEDFGLREKSTPLNFPAQINDAMDHADISIYLAQGKAGELSSFRQPMLKKVSRTKKVRHGHMPNISKEILILGFGEDYGRVVDLTHRVYDRVKFAKKATVKTALGTKLYVEFNPDYRWIASDALIKKGEYGNIPSGEVFTCVGNSEGTIVIDGEVGDYLCAEYGILKNSPVEIEIENGRAKSIKSKNKALVEDLKKYFKIDENANRIGEFAIGTNINLKSFIGNLLLDEKFPGIHVAFGSGYPDKTGASWDGEAHLDCIVTEPTVDIDGEVIMDKGNFLI